MSEATDQKTDDSIGYLIGQGTRQTWKSVSRVAEILGKLTIFVAIATWIFEIPDRAKEKHYRAWGIIYAGMGKRGNGGRVDALQDLNKDHVDLDGVDLRNAYLGQVQLPNAWIQNANFENAYLGQANFSHSRAPAAGFISKTSFVRADLWAANFRNVDFVDNDFSFANLSNAGFEDATFMRGVRMKHVEINNTRFQGATIVGVDFEGTDLSYGHFDNALFVDVDLSKAKISVDALKGARFCRTKLPDGTIREPNCELHSAGWQTPSISIR